MTESEGARDDSPEGKTFTAKFCSATLQGRAHEAKVTHKNLRFLREPEKASHYIFKPLSLRGALATKQSRASFFVSLGTSSSISRKNEIKTISARSS
jgi:hypothetical protein